MVSSNSSIYKTPTTIILKGKPITSDKKKKAKLLEFISRAPLVLIQNRETVASLFFKRTGVLYQNWIQAWAVTKLQKTKKGGDTKCHCNKHTSYQKR